MAVVSGEQAKRRRCGITELPDCIMENIVSKLCLKDAVNTILASPSQWKHLSHQILTRRNLEFDYLNIFGNNYSTLYDIDQEFFRRVSRYLHQYQGDKVDSFKLRCRLRHAERVILNEWIGFAFSKGIEELHLAFGCFGGRTKHYVFPQSLHVGSTLNLKHLLLKDCILKHPTSEFDAFNRLTTLSLKNGSIDQSLMANLFSVCVLLESLTLRWCRMAAGRYYMNGAADSIVAGNRLTHLKLIDCEERTCRTEISALNLVSLEYMPSSNCRFFSIKAPRVSRIFFSNKRVKYTLLPQALIKFESCPGLEALHLQILAELPRISSIPTYGYLKQLRLDIDLHRENRQDSDDVDVNVVLDLIKAAPLLEELVILIYGGKLSETNPRQTKDHSTFTNDHLRMVEIQGFRGNWYDTELAICILEISPKLEKLVIDQLVSRYLGDGKYYDPWREHLREEVLEGKLKGLILKTDAQIILKNVQL
ncbi:F-box/FBD/LRR-repeat protein At1g13570-like [Argentina anserina]|uniref:F-box/FBD/LRR-repeat protein At1g13570-like n=1 Tax=Argentina anserina TaxID=57926 RepID=UPI00217657D8|nr:F-box/FBD/LRR-repeat protein At1g13570-like [Potentilla anserina]